MSDEPDLETLSLLDADDAENETDEGNDEIEGNAESGAGDDEGQVRGQDGRASQDGNERSERVSRQPASETIRTLRAERQRAEQLARDQALRLEALERTIQQQSRPDPALQARQAQEEAERVAMMAPHEVAQYYANKSAQQMQQQMHAAQRQQMDALDRMDFRSQVATNPLAKKFEPDVERVVAEQARNGFSIKREEALAYVVGKAMIAKAGTAAKGQRVAGAARVASQTTRRATPGGDVQNDARGARGDTQAARAKRLENQPI